MINYGSWSGRNHLQDVLCVFLFNHQSFIIVLIVAVFGKKLNFSKAFPTPPDLHPSFQKMCPTPINVENSTATFHLRPTPFTRDQFWALARNGICTEYAPRRFHGIVMRIRGEAEGASANNARSNKHHHHNSINATALLFRSGRVVLTGVRGPNTHLWWLVRHAAHRVRRRARYALCAGGYPGVGHSLQVQQLQMRNMVGCVRAAHRLRIEHLATQMQHQRRAGEGIPHTAFETVRRCCLDLCTFPALRCTLALRMCASVGSLPHKHTHTHSRASHCLLFCRSHQCQSHA